MIDWHAYIDKAKVYHGHLCSGQILGIRMGLLGITALGKEEESSMRDVVVFAESSRCMADAVYVVTGITVGKRRLKLVDYGKTALSFLDLASGDAYRVSVKLPIYPPKNLNTEQLLEFWDKYSDDDLFSCEAVSIDLPPEEMPGPPIRVTPCECCGEDVLDAKEVYKQGQALCKACAHKAYYRKKNQDKEPLLLNQGSLFRTSPWEVYDALLNDIPKELYVKKVVVGRHWIMVLSSTGGIGLAMNVLYASMPADMPKLEGLPLADLASRIKSWDFFEASIGMAAVNASINTAALTENSSLKNAVSKASGKAFEYHEDKIIGKKVAIIGHFPHLEKVASQCDLSILERKPQEGDFPDSAADYILPEQDSVFMTGTTLTNKTFPHLMDLTQNTFSCIVGPSTPMSPLLFSYGINALSGTVVTDARGVELAVKGEGHGDIFARGGVMVNLVAPDSSR